MAVFLCRNAGWLEASLEGLSHHDKKTNRGAFSELHFGFFFLPFSRLRSRFSPEMQPLPERCVATGLYVHLCVPSIKTRIIQDEAEDKGEEKPCLPSLCGKCLSEPGSADADTSAQSASANLMIVTFIQPS